MVTSYKREYDRLAGLALTLPIFREPNGSGDDPTKHRIHLPGQGT